MIAGWGAFCTTDHHSAGQAGTWRPEPHRGPPGLQLGPSSAPEAAVAQTLGFPRADVHRAVTYETCSCDCTNERPVYKWAPARGQREGPAGRPAAGGRASLLPVEKEGRASAESEAGTGREAAAGRFDTRPWGGCCFVQRAEHPLWNPLCVLGMSLNLSPPQCLHLESGNYYRTYFVKCEN